MKNLQRFLRSTARRYGVRTPLAIILALGSTISFWFSVVPASAAPPALCPVCHKHVATLMLPCGGIAIRRHLDHGDPPMACSATTSHSFADPLKPSRANQPQQQ